MAHDASKSYKFHDKAILNVLSPSIWRKYPEGELFIAQKIACFGEKQQGNILTTMNVPALIQKLHR